MTTPQYKWATGFVSRGVDAAAVAELIEKLEERDGLCRPETLVEEARSETSPAHPLIFPYDDQRAAYEHRLELARSIIRSIRIIPAPDAAPRRVHVAITRTSEDGSTNVRGYQKISNAMADEVTRHQVMRDCLRGLRGHRERYADLAAQLEGLGAVWAAIDALPDIP